MTSIFFNVGVWLLYLALVYSVERWPHFLSIATINCICAWHFVKLCVKYSQVYVPFSASWRWIRKDKSEYLKASYSLLFWSLKNLWFPLEVILPSEPASEMPWIKDTDSISILSERSSSGQEEHIRAVTRTRDNPAACDRHCYSMIHLRPLQLHVAEGFHSIFCQRGIQLG